MVRRNLAMLVAGCVAGLALASPLFGGFRTLSAHEQGTIIGGACSTRCMNICGTASSCGTKCGPAQNEGELCTGGGGGTGTAWGLIWSGSQYEGDTYGGSASCTPDTLCTCKADPNDDCLQVDDPSSQSGSGNCTTGDCD